MCGGSHYGYPGRVYGAFMGHRTNQVRLVFMDGQILGLHPVADSSEVTRVRIAAIGDLHVRGAEDLKTFPRLWDLPEVADVLVVAGDLTENGRMLEAEAAAELL